MNREQLELATELVNRQCLIKKDYRDLLSNFASFLMRNTGVNISSASVDELYTDTKKIIEGLEERDLRPIEAEIMQFMDSGGSLPAQKSSTIK